MAAVLTMRQAAEAVGYSYDRFRKWWMTAPGFPRPFRGRRWDADAVAAWKARGSAREIAAPSARRRHAEAELEALRGA